MIWSVDQDDSDFSALTGLVGKSLPSFTEELKKTAVTTAGSWASLNGQKCMMSDCIAKDDQVSPPTGYATAPNGGPFTDNCGGGGYRKVFQFPLFFCMTLLCIL